MSKRAPGFGRKKQDAYDTIDPRAVKALLPYLRQGDTFIEPCAGAGKLAESLVQAVRCTKRLLIALERKVGVRPMGRGA